MSSVFFLFFSFFSFFFLFVLALILKKEEKLQNGVRALMLDTYDFEGDIWLCHSRGGKCYDLTAFVSIFFWILIADLVDALSTFRII